MDVIDSLLVDITISKGQHGGLWPSSIDEFSMYRHDKRAYTELVIRFMVPGENHSIATMTMRPGDKDRIDKLYLVHQKDQSKDLLIEQKDGMPHDVAMPPIVAKALKFLLNALFSTGAHSTIGAEISAFCTSIDTTASAFRKHIVMPPCESETHEDMCKMRRDCAFVGKSCMELATDESWMPEKNKWNEKWNLQELLQSPSASGGGKEMAKANVKAKAKASTKAKAGAKAHAKAKAPKQWQVCLFKAADGLEANCYDIRQLALAYGHKKEAPHSRSPFTRSEIRRIVKVMLKWEPAAVDEFFGEPKYRAFTEQVREHAYQRFEEMGHLYGAFVASRRAASAPSGSRWAVSEERTQQ